MLLLWGVITERTPAKLAASCPALVLLLIAGTTHRPFHEGHLCGLETAVDVYMHFAIALTVALMRLAITSQAGPVNATDHANDCVIKPYMPTMVHRIIWVQRGEAGESMDVSCDFQNVIIGLHRRWHRCRRWH